MTDSRFSKDLTKIFSKNNLKSRQRKFAKYFSLLFSQEDFKIYFNTNIEKRSLCDRFYGFRRFNEDF